MTQLNTAIIREFEHLLKQIQFEINISPKTKSNYFRLRQIKNIINIIKKYPTEIKQGSDIKHIKGIGSGTTTRIDEILTTNKLSEIYLSKTDDTLNDLTDIHGIGNIKALELIKSHNITSIKELQTAIKNNLIQVNDQILMGLKYHKIYKKNIPRHEITKIDKYLHKVLFSINQNTHLIICGSYRRQSPTSNDIDILITDPTAKYKINDNNLLTIFVNTLKKEKFIVDDLTHVNPQTKYMGFCKLNKYPVRRIDIRFVPDESYYPALLYFTGSGEFNQQMRNIAKELGYKLNEYGLFHINTNEKVKVTSEIDIFNKLGMEYLEPRER